MTSIEPTPGARAPRHFGLDWLRIAAFALLILNHIGMYFIPGPWVVKSTHPTIWVSWLLDALGPWRLSLLFLVSGYASHALLRKVGGIGAFFRARSRRLLIPLAFGTAVVVPPQGWVRLMEKGYSASFPHFWVHDWFRFSEIEGVFLPNTEHLWFVTYLWTYTALLCLAILLFPARWKQRLAPSLDALLVGYRPLIIPMALLVFLRLALLFLIPESGNILTNWHGHIVYVPAFLFGFALASRPAALTSLSRCFRPALLVGLGCYLVVLKTDLTYPGDAVPPHLVQALARSAAAAMGWAVTLLLVIAAHRWLRRDHWLRRPLSQAVFPFYIIHQTIIVVVGWEIRPLGYSASTEFTILIASTVAGCWSFYELGRRVRWLRPLIGLAPAAPSIMATVQQPCPQQAS
jgi:hypothetical protein